MSVSAPVFCGSDKNRFRQAGQAPVAEVNPKRDEPWQSYPRKPEPAPNRPKPARLRSRSGFFTQSTLPPAKGPTIAPPLQPKLIPGDVGEWLKPVPC